METDLPSIAKQLKALDRADIKNWLRRGELLTLAKNLAPKEADYNGWLRKQGIALRTAQKAIAAWRDFGHAPTSARFSIEAMSILARSPEARDEAVELAESKRITTTLAKALVAKHMPATHQIAASRPTLAQTQADGYFEVFNVEEYTFTIAGPGNPTASDVLGLLMHVQRELRDRMKSAA